MLMVRPIQAVCTLETRRRENDKRIKALHVEMKDMMAVLVRYVNALLPAALILNFLIG